EMIEVFDTDEALSGKLGMGLLDTIEQARTHDVEPHDVTRRPLLAADDTTEPHRPRPSHSHGGQPVLLGWRLDTVRGNVLIGHGNPRRLTPLGPTHCAPVR